MVNLLHSVRYTGISLAALLSLGMSGGQSRCPPQSARAERPQPAAVPAPAHAPAPAPNLASSWMDYIDFRRGSGDALTNLGGPALAAELARPRHPTPDT